MKIEIENLTVGSLFPVTLPPADIKVAGRRIGDVILERLAGLPDSGGPSVRVKGNFLPSPQLALLLRDCGRSVAVRDCDGGEDLLTAELPGGAGTAVIRPDDGSLLIRHPWDLLTLNELLVGALDEDVVLGSVRDGVTVDGHVRLGRGSVLLPGVYIEGNAVIGENCKIGPNCYIRGSTSIGDNCHVGQAVEIKNSLLFDHVSVGHLSYVGDSVICGRVNFGAGTVISNFRHDGRNHRWKIGGDLIDTGRRKFGAVIGEGVHTGIHTAIYPGRMLPPGAQTRPGAVVQR